MDYGEASYFDGYHFQHIFEWFNYIKRKQAIKYNNEAIRYRLKLR